MNYVFKIKEWVRKNRTEAFILTLILFTAAFFRLYRIDEYMTFLGDEGRDVIVVRRLLVNFDPILIGPGTSIGDMYLGPLYYYLMAPALLFANFSPVGPAVMVALLGVTTVLLVWWVARDWFPVPSNFPRINIGALVASGLYAISPVVITYSKSSWNPNIMPFFALLSVYLIWKVWQQNYRWLLILGISFAFVLQSHYLGLSLIPVIVPFWTLKFLNIEKSLKKDFIKASLIGFITFLVLMSPLFIFDARHGWRNFSAMRRFFLERQTTVSAKPWSAVPKVPETALVTNASLISAKNENISLVFTYGTFFIFLLIIKENLIIFKNNKISPKNFWQELINDLFQNKNLSGFLLLLIWLTVAYTSLGIYKQHIYDHYFGFFFPAPFLLIGGLSSYIYKNGKLLIKIGLTFFLVYLVYYNLINNPLKYPPNRQLQRTEEVSQKINEEGRGEKFNLAVLAERNYEGAYQYFFERWDAPVVMIDPQRADATTADQLFVVCELPREKCDPTHNPKAEVANFGWSKIEGSWDVGGTILFKLVHSQ